MLVALLTAAILVTTASTASAVIVHLANGKTLSYQPLRGQGTVRPLDAFFSNLDYNGGPVMSSNTNYAVYWSPSGPSAYPSDYQPGVNKYLTDLAHDSGGRENTDSVSTQYNDAAGDFANYNTHFAGALIDTDPYPANGCKQAAICLTDAQLRAELVKYVSANHLPTDLAHEYFLLTPPKVEDCFEASGLECSAGSEAPAYCAYHSNIPLGEGELIYSNDPYVTGNAGCDDGNHPNGTSSDGALQGGLSHEHNESITDPEPNNAWADFAEGRAGAENGDKCRTFTEATEFGTPLGEASNGAKYNQVINGDFYWYQQEWSNQNRQCLQRLTFSGAEPTATFTSKPGAGNEMTFDATGSTAPGGAARYNWQFNDGPGPSVPVETTTPTVPHTFTEPGIYLVALTVFANDGTSIGTARIIAVGDEGPTAAFTATALPTLGQPVSFDGSTSSDPDGSIKTYSWNFGDGSAAGTGSTPSHTYAATGTYTATLTITDSSGQTAIVPRTVVVDEAPSASFTISPNPGKTGSLVGFSGGASSDSDGTIESYSWDFGDGSKLGNGATPTHEYATLGTYEVKLTVTDNGGRTGTVSRSVTIKSPQAIAFTSTAPSSAWVGGPTYTPAATASSGLTGTFSSQTPAVCSVAGATVSFIAVGTCTIDANQAGNGQYEPAPQTQQSFAVGAAPTSTSTSTSTLTPTLTSTLMPTLTPTLTPDSNFTALGVTLSSRTGAITFTESVNDPGMFSWLLTFQNGRFGAFASKSTKCKNGLVKLSGRCRPSRIVFGKGAQAVAAAGTVTFAVRPGRSASMALRNTRKQRRGIPVAATLTFQSSHGGSPVSHTRSLTVKLNK